jgi:hypothetical protein
MPNAGHLYEVELWFPDGTKKKVDIDAMNRNSAAKRAVKQYGGEVASVNMIG